MTARKLPLEVSGGRERLLEVDGLVMRYDTEAGEALTRPATSLTPLPSSSNAAAH